MDTTGTINEILVNFSVDGSDSMLIHKTWGGEVFVFS